MLMTLRFSVKINIYLQPQLIEVNKRFSERWPGESGPLASALTFISKIASFISFTSGAHLIISYLARD